MITKLSLENWKSHAASRFEFGKATNVLLGRMGSGKSSVLDALCFALYGTFPKISRRDQSTESLVNLSSGAEFALVQLEFEKSGKKYEVTRKVGKKVSEAEVRCDGKLVQKGAKSTTEYIEGVLGVDYELFTRAIYSEQNKIDYLLSLNPRQRKQEIDWLLGLGQFDIAREAAQAACSKLSEQSSVLSTEADATRLASLGGKIGEQAALFSTKKENLAQLMLGAAQTFAKKNELENSFSSLEKLRADWKTESTACELAQGALQRLRKETEGKQKPSNEKLHAFESEKKKSEQGLLEARALSRKILAELSAIKSELAVLENSERLAQAKARRKSQLQEKLAHLSGGKDLEQLEGETAGLKKEIERLSDEHAAFHAKINELTTAVQALSSGAARCSVCDSELGSLKAKQVADGKKSGIDEMGDLAEKNAKKLLEAKSRLAAAEKNVSEIRMISSELRGLADEGADQGELQKKILESSGRKKEADSKAIESEKASEAAENGLEKARLELEDARRAFRLFGELEAALQQLASAQQKLSQLNFSEENYESVRKAAEALRLDYARAEAESKGEEMQLALLSELISSLQNEKEAILQKQLLAKRYSQAAESLAIYKNSLSAAQSELRTSLVEEINAALFEIWPAVYPYSDYGSVKLEADEKDYRLLMEKGGWREVDSVASGGERACLCLALRIAFATVLTPDVGWLILDEPTHNLDADAVALLSEAISSKIPSIVEQIFVITHDSALGENSQGQVYRLERDKGKNESTKVERQGAI